MHCSWINNGKDRLNLFCRKEVNLDAHGTEFLEQQLARIRQWGASDLERLAVMTCIHGVGNGAALGAHRDGELVGHVKETFGEEAADPVADHAIVRDDTVRQERINFIHLNVVNLGGSARAHVQYGHIHRREAHFITRYRIARMTTLHHCFVLFHEPANRPRFYHKFLGVGKRLGGKLAELRSLDQMVRNVVRRWDGIVMNQRLSCL